MAIAAIIPNISQAVKLERQLPGDQYEMDYAQVDAFAEQITTAPAQPAQLNAGVNAGRATLGGTNANAGETTITSANGAQYKLKVGNSDPATMANTI